MVRVATIGLTKEIHWLVAPSDRQLAPLKYLPGWSVIHPLTPVRLDEPREQWPTGDGRTTVARRVLHCVISEGEDTDGENDLIHSAIKDLLTRLRHVSKQATFPRRDDFAFFTCGPVEELLPCDFDEPYYGRVHFTDSSFLTTALTMDMVVAAGELPAEFEAPVYETTLLDAFKAVKDNDYRSALLYSAMAVEVMVGTVVDEEHQRMLASTPVNPHIRAVRQGDGESKVELHDPVYEYLRKIARFPELLHELPLYVLQRSLKLDLPDVYSQARKLYQTRNSLAHHGDVSKDNNLLPLDLYGAIDALKCVTKVFAWFGVPGNWPIPFEQAVDHWRRQTEKG
jgi:hypothetical protein